MVDTLTVQMRPKEPGPPALFHCLRGKNEIQREINSFVTLSDEVEGKCRTIQQLARHCGGAI